MTCLMVCHFMTGEAPVVRNISPPFVAPIAGQIRGGKGGHGLQGSRIKICAENETEDHPSIDSLSRNTDAFKMTDSTQALTPSHQQLLVMFLSLQGTQHTAQMCPRL